MIISKNFPQSSSRLAFRVWDYCRHNYSTFLHACPILWQNLVFSSRFWTADHRWWSNWFIKTISRRFISQETEQKWLVRPPRAKTLDAQNSFPLWTTGLVWWLLSSAWTVNSEHWHTMEISKHLTLDILYYLLSCRASMMEYQFIILYLLSIWDKRSWTW